MEAYNPDVTAVNAGLAVVRAEYEAAMRAQGVTVRWMPQDPYASGPFTLVDPGVAILIKDGFQSEVTVSAGRAAGTTGAALAQFDIDYALRFQAQISGQPLPSRWYAPEGSRGTPGPSTTVVPTATSTVQTVQSPHTPDAGTVVTNPLGGTPLSFNTGLSGPMAQPSVTLVGPGALPPFSADLLAKSMDFDEWNYYYQQLTGRVGPSPEAVGAQRGPLYTVSQWWAMVKPWYGAGGGGTPPVSEPPAGGPPPANPPGGGPPVQIAPPGLTPQQTSAAIVAGLVLLMRVTR